MFDSTEMIGEKSGRIAFLGSISHKKGPMLLLHAFHTIHKHFPEMTLHIFGDIQDTRYALWFDHAFPELGLSDCSCYYGRIDDAMEVLPHCSYIISTSPLEGNPYNILEGLQCGLTPLIYSWVGAKGLYPREFIWENLDELVTLIQKPKQDPQIFKDFVKENYSKRIQFEKLDKIVENLLEDVECQPQIKKDSTVSAIIAVKNGAKTIDRAVKSLQDQTKPLEKIVIVDDASTDGTMKILQDLKSKSDIPIQIIPNLTSKWVFSARNEGAFGCSSNYIMFLDADDWVDPTYVEKASQLLDDNSSVSVIYPDIVYFNNKGNEKVFNQPEFSAQTLAQYNFISYSSMQRTESFKSIGGFSNYMNDCRNHLTEWALWLNYVKAGFGIKRLSQPLFHYFHDDSTDQMSSGYERSRDDMQLELALNLSDDHSEIQMTGEKKRIVLVVQGKDYISPSNMGFELMQVYQPLLEFGEVFAFQYDVEMKHYGQAMMQDRLKAFIDLVDPTYVFHFSYKDSIMPSTWNEITKKYCTICFHSDEWRYNEFCKEYEKSFRYAITTYPSVYAQMKHPGRILSQWGANQYYFKPIIDPILLRDDEYPKRAIDVSFVGQKHTNRAQLFGNTNVECYGSGWNSGFVDFKEVGKIIANSKISISPSMGVKGRQLKLRPFEITACNTFCLCEQMPGIEEFFVPDKEIVLFDTKEEMEEKINYYLDHEEERREITRNGYNRTIQNHLWCNRLKAIFSIIKEE